MFSLGFALPSHPPAKFRTLIEENLDIYENYVKSLYKLCKVWYNDKGDY